MAPSILVVDDDAQMRQLLQFQLQEAYDTEVCADAESAWKYLDTNDASPPDVVVLDVMMPGIDGYELLDRIDADARFDDTDVIMITARGKETDIVRALENGATDFITKPLSLMELEARIEQALEQPQ